MGGHALKRCALRRYKRAEYKVLEAEAVARARRLFRRVHVPSYFDNKEDFGDVDILAVPDGGTVGRIEALLQWRAEHPDADICQEPERSAPVPAALPPLAAAADSAREASGQAMQKIRQQLPKVFDSKEAVSNGTVLSLEFRGFQVDFIFVPEEKFHMARFYFGWNIFGMLLGNICSWRGLKFGSDGLGAKVYYMPAVHSGVRKSDLDVLGTLHFSHDIYEVADFLGLPGGAARWEEGFASVEDLFAYISGSRVFDPRLFPHNDAEHNDLNARRSVNGTSAYAAFVDYVKQHHAGGSVASEGGGDERCTAAEGDSSRAEVDSSKAEGDTDRLPETDSWSFFYEALDVFKSREVFDNLIRLHERKEAVRARWQPRMMKSLLEAEGPAAAAAQQPTKAGGAGPLTGPEFGAMIAKFKRAVVLGRAEGGEGSISGQPLSQEEESSFEDWVLGLAAGDEVLIALEAFLSKEGLLQRRGS